LRQRPLPAPVGSRARPAVAAHRPVDQAVAVLPARQDRDADAGARRRRRHERADSRRTAAVSGAAAPRPRNRAGDLSRRDALDPSTELPAGSVRAVYRVVLEILEAPSQDVVAIGDGVEAGAGAVASLKGLGAGWAGSQRKGGCGQSSRSQPQAPSHYALEKGSRVSGCPSPGNPPIGARAPAAALSRTHTHPRTRGRA